MPEKFAQGPREESKPPSVSGLEMTFAFHSPHLIGAARRTHAQDKKYAGGVVRGCGRIDIPRDLESLGSSKHGSKKSAVRRTVVDARRD